MVEWVHVLKVEPTAATTMSQSSVPSLMLVYTRDTKRKTTVMMDMVKNTTPTVYIWGPWLASGSTPGAWGVARDMLTALWGVETWEVFRTMGVQVRCSSTKQLPKDYQTLT